MISIEQALNLIDGKTTEQLRLFTRNRILGADIASSGSGHSTEPAEDVVIQLLANPKLDSEKRDAVLEGWMDVYRQVRCWLDEADCFNDAVKWKDVVVNLCRVVDVAEPKECKKYVKRLIIGMLDEESCPAELLTASVRAYMAYAQDEKNIRFWEDEILKNKYVAAYGFNALLEIDPKQSRIEEHLCDLWRSQINEDWPVNTAFLLRRAARIRNETALIYRVLLRLKNKDYSLWQIIEKELTQRPWTRQWLERLAEFGLQKHQAIHKKEQEYEITDKIKRYSNLGMELIDIKTAGSDFDKLYFNATMSIDIPDISHYGDLKRNVKDPRYTTIVNVEHYTKICEENEHASKAG